MDSARCKVSVLCLAYNHEASIRSTLDAFLAQDAPFPFEVLVNDDCSVDRTAAILREYESRYPDVIRPVYQAENLYSRDICIEYEVLLPLARGEYIAFCEGDDYWCDPEKLRLQTEFLDTHPEYSACVHNSFGEYPETGRTEAPLFPGGDRDLNFSEVAEGMSFVFHTSSILARREFVENPPDFLLKSQAWGFTDYPQSLWLAHNGKIRFLDRPMSVYRIASNPDAWSSNQKKYYDRRKQFVTGEIVMFESMLPLLTGEERDAAQRELHKRRFELAYITGHAEELLDPEYADLFSEKSRSFRASTRLKAALPHLHRLYRRRKGYGD